MASEQPAKVFISSTSEDLKAHREAARYAALAAGMLPVMMEYFAVSGVKPPLPACLAKVSGTDVLVVIVAHRYGWVPPDQARRQKKSITWLECEQAVSEGKEVLAFLLDEKHGWPEKDREAYRLTEAIQNGSADERLFREVNRNVELLKEFKAWLNGRGIRSTFTTPEDLRRCVGEALNDWHCHRAAEDEGEPKTRLARSPEATCDTEKRSVPLDGPCLCFEFDQKKDVSRRHEGKIWWVSVRVGNKGGAQAKRVTVQIVSIEAVGTNKARRQAVVDRMRQAWVATLGFARRLCG